MNLKIAIIDYKMSNLFSIQNALNSLGFDTVITSEAKKILNCDGAVLPGVGSFPTALENLKNLRLDKTISKFVSSGRPFMGICLGMQLLFEQSEEFEITQGLGLIEGSTRKFKNHPSINTIPHLGWNSVKIIQGRDIKNDPTKDISDGDFFYFIHSLYVEPKNKSDVKTLTTHDGFEFCSSIIRENIYASQFHPEKSGNKGLTILKNFFTL